MNRQPRVDRPARIAQAVLLLTALAGPVGAGAQASSPPLDDLAPTLFGRREGIPAAPILDLWMDAGQTLWLSTESGPRHYDGAGWSLIPFPGEGAGTQRLTRAVRRGPDGTIWVAQSDRVAIQADTGWRILPLAGSEVGSVYSMTLTSALDGTPAMVVGSTSGVFRITPDLRWEELAYPPGFDPINAMVAAREVPGERPELWIASVGGGIARVRQGSWRTWGAGEGLDPVVEHVMPAPAGDSIAALAATPSGAWALYGDQWRRVGPPVTASRVLRLRIAGRYESWVGSMGGDVLRSTDGVLWDSVNVPERSRGSRVQILQAIDYGLATPSVFVGLRSGALIRYRVGVAGRLRARSGVGGRSVTEAVADRKGSGAWLWPTGSGAVQVPSGTMPPTPPGLIAVAGYRVRLLARSRDPSTELLAALHQEVWRLRGGRWTRSHRLSGGDTVRSFIRARAPDGTVRPVLVTENGAFWERDDGTFTPWAGFPTGIWIAAEDPAPGGPRVVVLDRDLALWREGPSGWVRDVPGTRPPFRTIHEAVGVAYPSGERAVWVGTGRGVWILRLTGAPAWSQVDSRTLLALRSDVVRDIQPIDSVRVGLATPAGLVIVRRGGALSDPPVAVGSYADADGLPHQSVWAMSSVDAAGRLWVGTETGAGYLVVDAIGRDAIEPHTLALVLTQENGGVLSPAATVPYRSRSLVVTLRLATGHREEDSRFRLELDGVDQSSGAWSDQATATMLALAPGRHVLRAWAVDWRGVVTGPVTRTITVAAPWWRTTFAYIAYSVLLLGGWWGVAEARVRTLRARTAAAVESERRLAGSELRFRTLFEAGVTPQLLVQDRRIWRANNAAVDMLSPGDPLALVNTPVESVLPELAGTGPAPADRPSRVIHAHTTAGELIPVELRTTVIPLEGGTVTHLQLRDLREERRLEAERRSLQEQLVESQRLEALGTLAGGVAHDFNNLLTVIQGNAELAVEYPGDEATPSAMRHILVAAGRARDIVKQILTFSRPSRAQLVPVSIRSLVGELLPMLRASIPSSVRIEVTDATPEAQVEGDPTQLHQMLLNLCTNAEYAMRARGGGTLTIATAWGTGPNGAGGRWVVIRVSDTGTGMAPEVQARVFEPFFTTKPVGEGTGLGLSVLHGIVGAHGGTVRVESEPGRGTTFEVRLPAMADGPAGAGPTRQAAAVSAGPPGSPPAGAPAGPRA